jgi:hypothetical protein
MLDEKKIQDQLMNMEAAAKVMLCEVEKIRGMFKTRERQPEINLTAINLRKRRLQSIKKACCKQAN